MGKQFDHEGYELSIDEEIYNSKYQSFCAKAVAFAIAVSYLSNIISKCEIKHFQYNPDTNRFRRGREERLRESALTLQRRRY